MLNKSRPSLHLLCRLCLFSALPAFISGCASAPKNLPEQKLTRKVDLPRFMGKWYVIASNPTMFESGATNATETYTWNEEKQRIDVDFRFHQDNPDGKEKTIPQKGFVYDHDTNAEWRIQPFWPLKFGYLIIGLADDYSDTTIGTLRGQCLDHGTPAPHSRSSLPGNPAAPQPARLRLEQDQKGSSILVDGIYEHSRNKISA